MEKQPLDALRKEFPLVNNLAGLEPVTWLKAAEAPDTCALPLSADAVTRAAARLKRFSSYFVSAFPETGRLNGILESPLVAVPKFQRWLAEDMARPLPGRLWLKLDSQLPVSGSIKARGGIYEVLKHAEDLAVRAGKLSFSDDYAVLNSKEFKTFFSAYSLSVGSTGNLGLSIGLMGAALGFRTSVHMSAEARQWKKDMLRAQGVQVVEYASDYSEAVRKGREAAKGDPNAYFVDDENSRTLFLGYAVAAHRLARQLASLDVTVDREHPLFVYLPCGVGGGPGGVSFGLKMYYGENAHCIFCEPTHCPSMFLGVYTGLHDKISVHDIGLDNKTAADGLACARPSGFVGKTVGHLLDGFLTVSDDPMFRLLARVYDLEGIAMEPSAAVGLPGMGRVLRERAYLDATALTPERLANATHIAWITGGGMVPEKEMQGYIAKGRSSFPGPRPLG